MPAKSGGSKLGTQWLSVEDIANELSVSIETVRNWIRKRRLIAYRVGRDYRVKKTDYEKFLEERRTGGQADEEE